MNPADCPYRPGTPEWSAWQQQWITEELRRRADTGELGATSEEKVAAGLTPTSTVFAGSARRLDDYPEPWRSGIKAMLYQPQFDEPGFCRWCGEGTLKGTAFKYPSGLRRHEANCYKNPEAVMYVEGAAGFSVNMHGRMVGWWANDAAYHDMVRCLMVLNGPVS